MVGPKAGLAGTAQSSSGEPEIDVRALLREIPTAVERLLDSFDAAGVDRRLRHAPSNQLHLLDRRLPRQSLDDFFATCEAYALVSAPTSLAAGDEATVRVEAERLWATLEMLLRSGTRRRGLSRLTSASSSLQAPLLSAALEQRPVQGALQDLIDIFGLLSTAEGRAQPRKRALAWLLPSGGRFLMPGSVLLTALALIVFLLGSMAFATGGITISSHGIGLGHLPGGAQPIATKATSPTTGHAPTATPNSAPTAAPATPQPTAAPGGNPTLTASALSQDPCPGGSASTFTITYSSGQGSITWTASPDNASNMRLSRDGVAWSAQVSGKFQQVGQRVTIYVQGLTMDVTGQINVSTNAGSVYTVSYDTTGC